MYCLGAVLYEFLSGVRPFEKEKTANLGLDEFRAMVQVTDPVLPSVRFSMLDDQDQNSIADKRNTVAAGVESLLKGELDWIVVKCLEKDQERRYQSAHELAEDLTAYIELKPVSAAAPSVLYRMQKFIRRKHLKPVLWTVLPAAVFLILALVFYWQVQRTSSFENVSPLAITFSENTPSVAVLPFEELGVDEESAFSAESFHNELTTSISRIQNIRTVTSNSTIRYKGSNKPALIVARELGVSTLLIGSFQLKENQIHIDVQLVDPQEEQNLWKATYTREYRSESLFQIQSEISSAIAGGHEGDSHSH